VKVVTTFAEVRAAARGEVGLVPTMGFLHEGHLSLARAARDQNDAVVMSIFVNPLQFAEDEDLASYPNDAERDAELAASVGVDVLFAPSADEMYQRDPLTTVRVQALEATMEGASRPGHFGGVAIVVAKLFAGVRPDRAYFGRKDAQQLAIVRRMAEDLSFPIDVVGCPIVREHSGLALSSRNAYLSPAQRGAASVLSGGLMAAADLVEAGERSAGSLIAAVQAEVRAEPEVAAEYVALAAADDVTLLERLDRPAFLAVAAKVGPARLIDNVHFDEVSGGYRADRGTALPEPSVLYDTVLRRDDARSEA
jgi:pantoate--beta-alanine ligase